MTTLDEKKSRIRDSVGLLTRWLRPGARSGMETSAVDETPVAFADQPDLNAPAEQDLTEASISSREVSPSALSIIQKLGMLKKTLHFDEEARVRLDEIQSGRDLLIYIYEVLFSKFSRLRDIGVISSEASKVLDTLDEKIGTVLALQDLRAETAGERLDAEALNKEVNTLKQELKDLQAKYIKSGVISNRELALEEENKRLQRRERDHRVQLRIARENLKALWSTQEEVGSLRARNSLMRSRIENQSRLLRGMAEGNPKHEGAMSRINNLTEENRRLQAQLEGQSEVFSRFQMHLPADLRQSGADLTSRNAGLLSLWKDKSSGFDTVITRESGGMENTLLENMENLAQENAQLKKLIETRQVIGKFIEGEGEAESSNPRKAIEALRMENQRIEAALEAREEEIKVLVHSQQDRPLMKAFVRIRSEYQELLRDNARKDQRYRQMAAEKRELETRHRDRHVLIRENHKLKTDLETMGRAITSLQKSEARYQALKREFSVFRGQYDTSQVECKALRETYKKLHAKAEQIVAKYKETVALCGEMRAQKKDLERKYEDSSRKYEEMQEQYHKAAKKLSQVSSQYDLLVKEYESIFNR